MELEIDRHREEEMPLHQVKGKDVFLTVTAH